MVLALHQLRCTSRHHLSSFLQRRAGYFSHFARNLRHWFSLFPLSYTVRLRVWFIGTLVALTTAMPPLTVTQLDLRAGRGVRTDG